ncbi:hypothetical protein GFB56_13565 [Ensifer sp. T173]|jgi:hypothetical protein|uniref:General stress protein 17M-like domain-containing protein n=1 Tax=Ensifer canadensis TaxID=555315 RepID=A0AAW4FLC1_9HYPH|nr:hypothetical protein [Ensifer canadensis]MBM3091839.1 hypothetical protein [Ensifer canadensis]UBI77934.1 hypothetical protein J3R84_25710 [Ensifer canadensis]
MTNLYDDDAPSVPGSRAKSTLTAFFDSRSDAETAIDKLKEAGVADVRLMPGYEADGEGALAAAEGSGFWSRLGDWFFPDEDRDVYAEGLRRGGFLVSVSVDAATYDTAHGILDEEGAIDLDERADIWRTEGWTGGRDRQEAASRDDAFQADVTTSPPTGVGLYARSAERTSPRVRAYELTEELPDDVVDDVLPTGHQRDVSESDRPVEDRMTQSQSIDDLRQSQILPGSR